MKPLCISFAGPLGCSKSPVAQYLSCELDLPILANDVVRNEVREDTPDAATAGLDTAEYVRRVTERLRRLIDNQRDFIHDASNDRHWERFLKNFEPESDYRFLIISFDLSPEFYRRLLAAKKYALDESEIARYLEDHEKFTRKYGGIAGCAITDETFADRLAIALAAAKKHYSGQAA